MTQFNSLEEGLNNLLDRMEVDMPQFNQTVKDMFYTRCYAAERLMNAARDSSTDHTAWMNMVGNPMETIRNAQQFDELCWWLSYEQLAEHFDVPKSWINVIRLQANTDPMKTTWTAKGLDMIIDGYLSESAYAAYLDGCALGLLSPSEGVDLLRDPTAKEICETNKDVFQTLLDTTGVKSSVDDALKGHDFWLA